MRAVILMLAASIASFAADAPVRPVRECAACHAAQAKPQVSTSMAHAAESIAECGVLRSHPLLSTHVGFFDYKIEREGDESFYTVSDKSIPREEIDAVWELLKVQWQRRYGLVEA